MRVGIALLLCVLVFKGLASVYKNQSIDNEQAGAGRAAEDGKAAPNLFYSREVQNKLTAELLLTAHKAEGDVKQHVLEEVQRNLKTLSEEVHEKIKAELPLTAQSSAMGIKDALENTIRERLEQLEKDHTKEIEQLQRTIELRLQGARGDGADHTTNVAELNFDDPHSLYSKLHKDPAFADVAALLGLSYAPSDNSVIGPETTEDTVASGTVITDRLIYLLQFVIEANYVTHNRCLGRNPSNSYLLADVCSEQNKPLQSWRLMPSGHIGMWHKGTPLCVTAPVADAEDHRPIMRQCEAQSALQQWEFRVGLGVQNRGSSRCLASTPHHLEPITMKECVMLERPHLFTNASTTLMPNDWAAWLRAFALRRQENVAREQEYMNEALQLLSEVETRASRVTKLRRRAIVAFYDAASAATFLPQLKWWIYTWRRIGLHKKEQAFDILVFCEDPGDLPEGTCDRVYNVNKDDRELPAEESEGEVICIPYVGGFAVDPKRFDPYFNR